MISNKKIKKGQIEDFISDTTQTALDLKLSNDTTDYTDATTPLAGTEIALVEQGGTFKKVAVSEFGGGGSSETFEQSRWMFTDFIGANSTPFISAVIGSGTSLGYGLNMQNGILGTIAGGGGNANNTGGRTATNMGDISVNVNGLTYINAFFFYNEPNCLLRNGFLNSNTHTEPTNGIYMQMEGNTAFFKTTRASVSTTTSSFTLNTSTWYVLMIERVSVNEAKFKIKNLLTNTLVAEETIPTNIPNVGAMGAGFVWTVSPFTGFGSDYVLDFMGVYYNKPDFLNDF